MAAFKWLIIAIVASTAVERVYGQCQFPNTWYDGFSFYWFDKWDANDSPVALLFQQDAIVHVTSGSVISECEASDTTDNWTMASLQFTTTTQRYCVEGQRSDVVIYWRTTARLTGGQIPLSTCESLLGDRVTFGVLIQYPFRANNFEFPNGVSRGGPPDGTYQFALATYGTDNVLGTAACIDDPDSTLTIAGNVITVTSACTSNGDQTYENPFNGELYIVNAMSDNELNVELDSTVKGVLTLAMGTSDSGTPYRFLLARYTVNNGRLEWLFSTDNPRDPTAYLSSTSIPDAMKQYIKVASTGSNECDGVACDNGGTCIQGWLGATCACVDGFEGTLCDINIDECSSSPCQNGGTCEDQVNFFTCRCEPGFSGPTCSFTDACQPTDPCENGGTCHTTSSGNFLCQCTKDYIGDRCEVEHMCESQKPCLNGGTCFSSITGYLCRCPPGFAGTNCENPVDYCDPNPCQGTQSTCSTIDNEIICDCEAGRTGPRCQSTGEACMSNPCRGRNAICTQAGDDIICQCEPHRSGKFCEFEITPPETTTTPPVVVNCEVDTCKNGGECIPTDYGFRCECTDFYDGLYCEDMSDWFIVAMVLVGLLGLIFLLLLVICCCYCCCGWRPGNNSMYESHSRTEYKAAAAPSPGTVQFNVSPATPYYGIQVMRDT